MYKTLDGDIYTTVARQDVTFDENEVCPGDKVRVIWNGSSNIREKASAYGGSVKHGGAHTCLAAHTTKPMISYLWLATNESLDVKRIRMHSLR